MKFLKLILLENANFNKGNTSTKNANNPTIPSMNWKAKKFTANEPEKEKEKEKEPEVEQINEYEDISHKSKILIFL